MVKFMGACIELEVFVQSYKFGHEMQKTVEMGTGGVCRESIVVALSSPSAHKRLLS
jgi:hypothetical protein